MRVGGPRAPGVLAVPVTSSEPEPSSSAETLYLILSMCSKITVSLLDLSFGPQSSVGENCTALPYTGMLAHFYLSGSLQALFFMFSAASSPILLSCSRLKPCPHLTPHSSPHSSRCRLTSSLTVKTRGRLRLPVKRLILLLWTACSVFSLIIRTFLWKKPVSSHFSLHSRPFCWFLPVTSK